MPRKKDNQRLPFTVDARIARLIREHLDGEHYQAQRLLPLDPDARSGS